jgi:hypothetical protein
MPDIKSGFNLIGGNKASNTLADGAGNALQLQKDIYNQQRKDNMPYLQAGQAGVNKLSDLLGLDKTSDKQYYQSLSKKYVSGARKGGDDRMYYFLDPVTGQVTTKKGSDKQLRGNEGYLFDTDTGFNVDTAGLQGAVEQARQNKQSGEGFGSLLKPFSMDDYVEDPGYQFRMQQGNQALDRANSARGNFLSGGAIKGALDYNSGLASQEYGNAYNRYNTDMTNMYNRLAGITGVGQTATGQVGSAGQNYANQGSEYITQQANAKAAGQANKFGQMGNIASSFGNLFGSQYGGM